MKLQLTQAVAASLFATPHYYGQVSAFSVSLSNNNGNASPSIRQVSVSSSSRRPIAAAAAVSTMKPAPTALFMSVSDEVRKILPDVTSKEESSFLFSSTGTQSSIPNDNDVNNSNELISAIEDANGFHHPTPAATNGHANGHANGQLNGHANGHSQPKTNGVVNGHANANANGVLNGHANGKANGVLNGHANGKANGHANGHAQSPEPASIMDTNGIEYKLTNGQHQVAANGNGQSNGNGNGQPVNGHHANGKANGNGHSSPTTTLPEETNGHHQPTPIQNGQLKVPTSTPTPTQPINSPSGFDTAFEKVVEEGVMKEAEKYAQQMVEKDIEAQYEQMALSSIDVELQTEDKLTLSTESKAGSTSNYFDGDGVPTTATPTTATAAVASTPPSASAKLSLSPEEYESLEKESEEDVMNNKAFHAALEQKVMKDVEKATEQIVEQCTTVVNANAIVNGIANTAIVDNSQAEATVVTGNLVTPPPPLPNSNIPVPTASATPGPGSGPTSPWKSSQSQTTQSTTPGKTEYKPFTPLPQVEVDSKNNYLDVLAGTGSSSAVTGDGHAHGHAQTHGLGQNGYLNKLNSHNSEAIAGSGVGGYLEEISQHNLKRKRFRIPFISRLFNRKSKKSQKGTTHHNHHHHVVSNDEKSVVVVVEEESIEVKVQDTVVEIEPEVNVDEDITVVKNTVAEAEPPVVKVDEDVTDSKPEILKKVDPKLSFGLTEDTSSITSSTPSSAQVEHVNGESVDTLTDSSISATTTDTPEIEVTGPTDSLNTESQSQQTSDQPERIEAETEVATSINYQDKLQTKNTDQIVVTGQSDSHSQMESHPEEKGSLLSKMAVLSSVLTKASPAISQYPSENTQVSVEGSVKDEMKLFQLRKQAMKLSNIACLLCLFEVRQSIQYALPVGAVATIIDLLYTRNVLISSLGTLGLAMMYAATTVQQILPIGAVLTSVQQILPIGTVLLKRYMGLAGCALLLTSNYLSRRVEESKQEVGEEKKKDN